MACLVTSDFMRQKTNIRIKLSIILQRATSTMIQVAIMELDSLLKTTRVCTLSSNTQPRHQSSLSSRFNYIDNHTFRSGFSSKSSRVHVHMGNLAMCTLNLYMGNVHSDNELVLRGRKRFSLHQCNLTSLAWRNM